MKAEIKLREELNRIRSKLYKIEDRRALREGAKLIGKCFKYHNSYGHGEKWWLYKRVIDARKRGHTFEKTSDGEFIYRSGGFNLLGDDIPITRAEFDKAWQHFLKELEKAGK